MAVIKAKAQKVVEYALETMAQELISPYLTTRIADGAFVGAEGDTVTMRVGGLRAVARDYEFRTRSQPIQMDDIQGGGKVDFKLDKHIVSATSLTLEQLTLDTIDMNSDVVNPQALAVAESAEAKVLAKFATIPFKRELAITADMDPLKVAAEAQKRLSADKVAPTTGRFFLIGSAVAAAWLVSDRLSKYSSTGETGTPALRSGIIGRLVNEPVIVSNSVAPDFIHYGHKSALALATVAPTIPSGAKTGRQLAVNGFAGTWIIDYDAAYARDRSMFHAFMGLTDVRDERRANGDLIDPTGEGYAAAKNVRGLRMTATGFDGSLLD